MGICMMGSLRSPRSRIGVSLGLTRAKLRAGEATVVKKARTHSVLLALYLSCMHQVTFWHMTMHMRHTEVGNRAECMGSLRH
eukprot:2311461-Amphidinium_carterae.1